MSPPSTSSRLINLSILDLDTIGLNYARYVTGIDIIEMTGYRQSFQSTESYEWIDREIAFIGHFLVTDFLHLFL